MIIRSPERRLACSRVLREGGKEGNAREGEGLMKLSALRDWLCRREIRLATTLSAAGSPRGTLNRSERPCAISLNPCSLHVAPATRSLNRETSSVQSFWCCHFCRRRWRTCEPDQRRPSHKSRQVLINHNWKRSRQTTHPAAYKLCDSPNSGRESMNSTNLRRVQSMSMRTWVESLMAPS